ncbi:MAG: CDP-alcohol phosphatidyltransferase family protein [Gammaproteobacteria bacterium]|nr:CDP-alcohol phosphatidyltransferase family protein [Gammaproteobacteria bacterium]
MRHLPNAMTLMRMVLILPLGYLVFTEHWTWVFWLFVAAGISDLLDGALARHFHWETEFGSFIDPMADKVLCGGLILILALASLIPLWITVLVVLREVVIVGGAFTYQYLFGKVSMNPLLISKVNTGVMIAVLILVLAQLAEIPLIQELAEILLDPWGYFLLAGLLVCSGIAYVFIWSKKTRDNVVTQKTTESEG